MTCKKYYEDAFAALEKSGVAVLATGANGRITARSVSVVADGGKILFQTSAKTEKFAQIKENPNVAATFGNVQIEGVAAILGHPMDNARFVELFGARHGGSFAMYSHMASERVIEVTPYAIQLWEYEDGEPMVVRLDCKTEQVSVVPYAHGEAD